MRCIGLKCCWIKKFESPDDFVRSMVQNMKQRFDKYWGECNMLMAIGAMLDPRLKMRALEITFPKMFSSHVGRENISEVRDVMYQLYDWLKALGNVPEVPRSSPPGGTGVFTWSAAPGPRGISRGNGP